MNILKFKIKFFIAIIIMLLNSCKDNQEHKNNVVKKYDEKAIIKNDSIKNNVNYREIEIIENVENELSCEDCLLVLDSLVRTSSFDKSFKKNISSSYVVSVDEATKEKVVIKIMLDENNNIPLSWLELNLLDKRMYDTTKDDLNPELIKIDKNIFEKFKNKCLKCCLD